MTATNDSPDGGKNVAKRTERDLIIETVDGELTAIVTITGMGHETSPAIVEEIDAAIRSEVGHLISAGFSLEESDR